MKLVDGINNINGVDSSHWGDNRLVVYYLNTTPIDTIKIRIADYLVRRQIQDWVGEVKLISVPPGSLICPK